MRELEKSKRLSWASDVNLCQVRLFLSDESPAQVGFGTQEHLQAKSSWVSQSSGTSSDENLPPGFEGSHPTDLLKNKLSKISLSKWIRPPKLVLDIAWQVVAGEESKEVELQNQREMGILEAVYPRPSAIPLNPIALTDIEPSPQNELNIPLIPITPIEDEDMTTLETSSYAIPQIATSQISLAPNNNQINTIDPNLLMKLLNDTKWHEKLTANQVANHSPPSIQTNRIEIGTSAPMNLPFYPPPVSKDLGYYKSLVQQHGGEISENNFKSKKMTPCTYFNSPWGCRNGDSCPYEHDTSDLQSAKRMKMDSEINGE